MPQLNVVELFKDEPEPMWEIVCLQHGIDHEHPTPEQARDMVRAIKCYDINRHHDLNCRRGRIVRAYCTFYRVTPEEAQASEQHMTSLNMDPGIVATTYEPTFIPRFVLDLASQHNVDASLDAANDT